MIREKIKGTRAKEKKNSRGKLKVADSAQGENRMNEVFFFENMQGTTKDYGEK